MSKNLFRALMVGVAIAGFSLPSASAIVTTNMGAYSVTYDDGTSFGSISAMPASAPTVGFQFALPLSVSVIGNQVAAFLLPSFTVSVNPGYVLSGAVSGLIGNLAFFEAGGGQTLASVSGSLGVDGGPPIAFDNVLLTRVETSPGSGAGYYVGSAGVPFGVFSSLAFSGGTLNLASANNTGFAAIVTQPQNIFAISFLAVPVPELDAYAMLLAGLGLIGAVVRRRARQS